MQRAVLMGTVLLPPCPSTPAFPYQLFQSPSRWGRCCFAGPPIAEPREHSEFQSPSRWGRCCFMWATRIAMAIEIRFSPLLDGDGVASARWKEGKGK